MIRQLILLVQLLGLFFYHLVFSGDITVKQQIPNSISQGEETVIEITINKNDISGFAKIQQIFPDGFTAEPVDTKGATFSFKDNKVKFIWMSLPAESEFTISYKIKPNENTAGEFTIGGKFSFISESERQNIEIPASTFSVSKEQVVEEPLVEEPLVEEPLVEEPLVEEPLVEEPLVEEPLVEEPLVEEPVTNAATIVCRRSIENIEKGKYRISIEINKNGIQGFAKLTEQLPEGFMASENDSKGGVFSYKANDMKILWMAIPKEEKFTISYILESNTETVNGNYKIKGYFSYLENDVTNKYNIDASEFDLNSNHVIAEKPVVEEPVLVEEPVIEDNINKQTNNNKVTSIPQPETGVSYKVQVGAGHQKVSTNYFSAKFNLQDNVSTINHEGWIKYLVGSYDEYKLARDKRNKVRNNIKTAFVTAYNTGKRITVQEALMISNQKWYK